MADGQIKVESIPLRQAARWICGILPAKANPAILSCVVLTADGDVLTLSGFDGETWGRIRVPCEGRLTAAVSGRTFADFADKLDGRATLTLDGTVLRMAGGGRKYSLGTAPSDDYPHLPAMPEPLGEVDGLADGLARAMVSVEKGIAVRRLEGVKMIAHESTLRLSATRHVTAVQVDVPWSGTEFTALPLPWALVSQLKDHRGAVRIGCDGNLLAFYLGDREFTVKVMDESEHGAWPVAAMGRLMSDFVESPTGWLIAERTELLEEIQAATPAAGDQHPLALRVGQGELTIAARNEDAFSTGDSRPVKAAMSGDWPEQVRVMAQWLTSALSKVETRQVRLDVNVISTGPRTGTKLRLVGVRDAGPDLSHQQILQTVRVRRTS